MPTKKHVVFGMDLGGETFGMFWDELDLLLMAFAFSWEEERMTLEELRDAWRKIACEEWGYGDYADLEWEDFEEEEWFLGWENVKDGRFSSAFWEDAAYLLEDKDVYYDEAPSIAASPVFEIRGREALEAVRNALADRYEIIIKEDNSEYEPDSGMSPEEAKRFIEQARGG